MSKIFLKVVNMSISAGWLVLAVLALRFILKKAPKWVNVLLWGMVAVRLICPFSIESALSLIPSAETIPVNIAMDTTPAINSGISSINNAVNPLIEQSNIPMAGASVNPLQITIGIYANIWVLGMLAMVIYTAVSYITLCQKLRTAVILRCNIFQCETVSSPFVLGILKPRIYLPYSMDGKNLAHVLAHEQAHIRRKDHWWKPLGFLLLTVHWFNPLMWIAYIILCRDIELACDEKVIAEQGSEQRADYTQVLVACAVNRPMVAACPLAFGEVGVKDRIRSIMNYRKPTVWIIMIAAVVCVGVAVCFLTDPKISNIYEENGEMVDYGMYISKPEMSFPGLEAGGTKIDENWIEVQNDGAVMEYHMTYGSPAVILEFGLLRDDGKEIKATIKDGVGIDMLEDIPAGRYQLFVRNIGYVNDLPGETIKGGAVVCTLYGGTTDDMPLDPDKTFVDLTQGELKVKVEDVWNYVFYTNSTKIAIEISGQNTASGTVKLHSVESGDDFLQIYELDDENECVFQNLTSATYYMISTESLSGCKITVKEDQSVFDKIFG